MFAIKIDQILSVETRNTQASGKDFKIWKIICDSPYFDAKTGVHPTKRLIYAISSADLEIQITQGPQFVFATQTKRGFRLNGLAS